MKKELEDLREVATSLVTTKLTYDQKRRFFEKSVEANKNDCDDLYLTPITDHYSLAKDIMNNNTTIIVTISNVKTQHPKYRDARLKEEVIKIMKDKLAFQNNFVSESDVMQIEKIVNTYFLYVRCGVLDIIELEEALNRQLKNTDKTLETVIGEVDFVKTVKSTVMNFVGSNDEEEDIKSQVKQGTKKFVNEKSKKLVKLFSDVVEKTSPKE